MLNENNFCNLMCIFILNYKLLNVNGECNSIKIRNYYIDQKKYKYINTFLFYASP